MPGDLIMQTTALLGRDEMRGGRWGGGRPARLADRHELKVGSILETPPLSVSLSLSLPPLHSWITTLRLAGRSFQGSCETETGSLSHQTAMNIRRFRSRDAGHVALISSDVLTLPLIHPRLRVRLKFYTPRHSAQANNQAGRLMRFAVSDSTMGNRGVPRRVIAPPIYDRFHSFRGIAITSV
jgi:hypothetical protein